MTQLPFLFLCFTVMACSSSLDKKQVLKKHNSLDLHFAQENGFLSGSQMVTIENDPVYHKEKKYNAIPLLPLLQQLTTVDSLSTESYKVVFECEDGYKPEMDLAKLLAADAYVALSDLDAPKGRKWERVFKDGIEMKTAPYYVIYRGVSSEDYSYKWPYNLIKIHFEPVEISEIPPALNYENGRKLYQQHCKVCHALNGAGGDMGPELNHPISVTEYWKHDHLIAFMQNPQKYRTGVKMPNLGITKEESASIVAYLEEIAH